MRPPKTDCIFKISIKKYVGWGKNNLKIDTRNYRNNTTSYKSIIFVLNEVMINKCIKILHLSPFVDSPQR